MSPWEVRGVQHSLLYVEHVALARPKAQVVGPCMMHRFARQHLVDHSKEEAQDWPRRQVAHHIRSATILSHPHLSPAASRSGSHGGNGAATEHVVVAGEEGQGTGTLLHLHRCSTGPTT